MFLELWALSEMFDDDSSDESKVHAKSERDRIMNFKFHCVCGHEMDEHNEDGCHGENSNGFMKGKSSCKCDYEKDRKPVTFVDLFKAQEKKNEL